MNITEVIDLLEYTINKRIEELNKLMQSLRSLLNKKRLNQVEHECILNIRIAMAEIVKDLRPAKEVFLENNPEWKDIFEELEMLEIRNFRNSLKADQKTIDMIGDIFPCTTVKDRNPTTSDLICEESKHKYNIGDLWINKSELSTWILCDIKKGEALWQDIIYACGDFSKPEIDISQSNVSQADNNHTKQ